MIEIVGNQSSLELFLSSGVALIGAIIWFLIRQKTQAFEKREKYLFVWFFLLAFIGPDIVRFLRNDWINLHTCFVFYISALIGLILPHLEMLNIQSKSFWVFSFLSLFNHILIDQIFI
jgi:hypothetical protein